MDRNMQASPTIQEMEDKISIIEDIIEEIDTLVKENVKSKRLRTKVSRKSRAPQKDQICLRVFNNRN